MPNAPVRVAVLGTGLIAEFRAQVYARLQGAKVVSVLGRDRTKADAFAGRARIAHAATSWDALIEGPSFDAVDVCLPNNRHLEYVLLAAEAGKHVLCEKPLGLTRGETKSKLPPLGKAGVIPPRGE